MHWLASTAVSAVVVMTSSTANGAERALAQQRAVVSGALSPVRRVATGVAEASDVVALPDGRFLVVSDRSATARIVSFDGRAAAVRLPRIPDGESQLEGVGYAPPSRRLVVVREEESEAWRYTWRADAVGDPRPDGVVALSISGPRNKRLEGIAYVGPEWSPSGAPQWVLVKEGQPKALWLASERLEDRTAVALPDSLAHALEDFSAVAVDPLTGHIVIASQESAACARLRIQRRGSSYEAVLLKVLTLTDERGAPLVRVEGITFDAQGRLYALTENEGALREMREER